VSRIIFVTGTDTGVGKTVLTASLLHYFRESGVNALAMKPFCSGGTADVDLIQAIQGDEPSSEEVNPLYFSAPLAPLVAARKIGREIRLPRVLGAIRRMEKRCECLLVEGAGGLLVPLGEGFAVADVITSLECDVVVVGRNKLGTINHTLLTIEALRARGVRRIKVVLMKPARADFSTGSNAAILREILENIEVIAFPYIGLSDGRIVGLKRNAKKTKKTLALIAALDTFSPRSSDASRFRLTF
jgi:dethiobiotin synthetase